MSEYTQSHSQFGEDVLAWDYFRRKQNGYFVEVGANHPVNLSQTYLLEQNGWSGLLIEPQQTCCDLLRAQRPNSRVWQNACGSPEKRGKASLLVSDEDVKSALEPSFSDTDVKYTHTETVHLMTLDDMLEASGATGIDLLSVDVEGLEEDVFRGLDFKRYRPQLILVEDHAYHLDIHHYLQEQNYELVYRTGPNSWYIPAGNVFPLRTWATRWEILRKMYLARHWRHFKLWLKKRDKTSLKMLVQTFLASDFFLPNGLLQSLLIA